MKTLKNLFTVLLMLMLFSNYCFAAPAESTSDDSKTESKLESLISESKILLAKVNELSSKSAALKRHFKKAPETDLILFLSLVNRIEESLREKLDKLIEIKQALEKEKADTDSLLLAIRPIVVEQSKVLQQEIQSLTRIIIQMRNKENKGFASQYGIDRAELGVDNLIAQWQKNIQRGRALKLDMAEDSKNLDQLLQMRAIGLAGRIRLMLDGIKVLNEQLGHAGVEQQKKITQELNKFELRKTARAVNLENMVALMNKQGMESTEFGKVLVVATGEILNENVDTEAVIGIFQMITNKAMAWLNENYTLILFKFVSVVLILFFFKILAGILSRLVDRAGTTSQLQQSQLLKNFLSGVTSKTIMLIGIVVALSQLGIEIGPLLAGMGVMGFVVGFALQDSLSNFASGMMILVYRPYDIGDFVEVAGISGKVNQMNLVSTTILTFDHQRMVIPNNKIWGGIITNVTAERIRRVDFVFGIGYADDLSKAESVLENIIASHELILEKPEPLIKVHNLGESSVDFIVRPWVNSKDYWDVYWDITRQVKDRFDVEGISIPFPQRDVHIYSKDENT